MRNFVLALSVAMLMTLSGCGNGSKQDIMTKASGASSKEDLQSKLGKPDKFESFGLGERWTYKASDGDVNFNIVGGKVVLSDTITPDKK